MRNSIFAILCLVMACGSNGKELLDGFDPGPPPPNGMQIILPIVRGIKPGSDNEICTWTEHFAEHDLDVRLTQGFQSLTGHHIVLFYTKDPKPPGTTRVCSDDDMASFRFVAGAGEDGTINQAPGNLVYRIPRGAQIVINHHYLNPSPRTYDAQSALNVVFAEPGMSYIPSGAVAVTDTEMKVPPGESQMDIEAVIPRDLRFWFLIPHMHEWGRRITIDHVIGQNSERLFDVADWKDEYAFHPPELRKPPEAPLIIKAGERLRVHCEWGNDTGRVLTFGFEMCVAFGQTVDSERLGNLSWDGKNWGAF